MYLALHLARSLRYLSLWHLDIASWTVRACTLRFFLEVARNGCSFFAHLDDPCMMAVRREMVQWVLMQ